MTSAKLPAVVVQVGGIMVESPQGNNARKLLKARLGELFDLEFRCLKLNPSTVARPAKALDQIVETVDELRLRGKVVIATVLDANTGVLTQDLIDLVAHNVHALGSLYLLTMPTAGEKLVLMNRNIEVRECAF